MKALAFDIGATHCRLALVTAASFEVVITGGANASSNLNHASQAIIASVNALAEKVRIEPSVLTGFPAYLGVAGVINRDVAEALEKRLPFKIIKIEEDRVNALKGALGMRDGFLVHCGTGSFFARQRNGIASFAGGWGSVLDDIASANWLGVQALQTTLYAEDGLLQHTGMSSALLSEFDGTGGIVAYANRAKATDLGKIAKTVTQYALQGDEMATGILKNGAAIITEKLSQFGYGENDPICLTGSVAPEYKSYLPVTLQSDIVDELGGPLDGAIALAREFYTETESR